MSPSSLAYRLPRIAAAILVAAVVAGVTVALTSILFQESGQACSGTVADHSALSRTTCLKAFVGYFPLDVESASFVVNEGRVEAHFPYTDSQFVDWAKRLGWSPDVVLPVAIPTEILLLRTDGGKKSILQFAHGYWLSAAVQRKGDGVLINDVLVLAFDSSSQTAYLQLDAATYGTATRRWFRRGGLPLSGSWLDDSEQVK